MKEFRDRVLLPLTIPLGALAVIAVVVLNLSRVLLALEERASPEVATAIAVVMASAVLFGFTYVSARGEERSLNNMATLAAAGMAIVFSGVVGFEAVQEAHDREAGENPVENLGPADVVVAAFDIGFRQKEVAAPAKAGGIVIEYVNEGGQAHTFLLDEVPGFKLEVTSKGATDTDKVELQPGTYTYFCDIPGHRAGGMEGRLSVTEGAGAP